MKRILTMTLAVLATMALYSCGDDCPEPNECEVPILFKVNPNSLLFGSDDQDAQAFFVTAMNVTWRAEVEASAQDWLKITVEQDKISVRVEENEAEQDRTGTITVTPENETLNPVVVTVTQTLTETIRLPMHMALWTFLGDSRDCGYANYEISLGGGDGYFDEKEGTIKMTEGYAVILEVLTEEISRKDYQVIEVKTGTFKQSIDPLDPDFKYEKWSFLRTFQSGDIGHVDYDGSWLLHFSGIDFVEQIVLTGGQVTVEGTSGNYHVVADLVTNRNERLVMEYNGPFDDIRSGVSYSTYTEDREITGLTQGGLYFYGENSYTAPGTYCWYARLQTPQQSNGTELQLWLYSPMTDILSLDSGDYVIQNSKPFTEFTVESGYLFWGAFLGAWVVEYDETGTSENFSPLIEGTISVVNNGNNNYTVTADALMDNYWNLTAFFEGDLTYANRTSVSAAASFKGVPYKMENRETPRANLPDWSKRSVRYGLANID